MDAKAQRILNIYETGVSETELTETLKTKINASIGGSLGSIKPTDAAPTPARNGNYTFSIGGAKPAWLTAEAGITTVKAGDGVAVVYAAPSSYTYTHVNTGSSIEQARSQSTLKVPSSKLVDDELNKIMGKVDINIVSIGVNAENWVYALYQGSGNVSYGVAGKTRIITSQKYAVKKGDVLKSSSSGVKVFPILYDSTTGDFISDGAFAYEHIIAHDGDVLICARLEPSADILDISAVAQWINIFNNKLTKEVQTLNESVMNVFSGKLIKNMIGSNTDVFTKTTLLTGDFNLVKIRVTSTAPLNLTSPNGQLYGCLAIYVGDTEYKYLTGEGKIMNQNSRPIGSWDKTQPVDVTFYFITTASTISYADRIMSSSAFNIEVSTAKADLENLFSIVGVGDIGASSAGSIVYSANYNYSDYIPVSVGDELLYTGTVASGSGIAMYDINKSYLGMLFNYNMYPNVYTLGNSPRFYYKDFYLVIPSGTAFIRACNAFQGNSSMNMNGELYNLSAKRNLKQVVEISERVFDAKIADVNTGSPILSNDEVYLGAKKVLLWNPYKDVPASPIKIDGQLHVHTNQSDGGETAETVASKIAAANYKFWTITDHNRVTPKPSNNDSLGLIWIGESYESTDQRAGTQHLCVYMGELETYDSTGLSLGQGDTDLFGVVDLYGLNKSMNEIIEHYATTGNLINYAHPFWTGNLQTEAKVKSAIAGIGMTEVLNSSTVRSDDAWDWQLQEGRKVFGIAVDDYHNNPSSKERCGWIEAWVSAETKQEVLKTLFTGCFVAANGVVPLGGVEGDGINGITITSLSFINGLYLIQTDIPCTFKFINQTGVSTPVKTVTSANSATYELSISDRYVRCEISADSGVADKPWIKWTQPVFVIGEKLSYEIN